MAGQSAGSMQCVGHRHSAADLFRLAAWALARVTVVEWPTEKSESAEVELQSDGWDDLLVNWMNQLIFLSERHRAVWTEFEFRRTRAIGSQEHGGIFVEALAQGRHPLRLGSDCLRRSQAARVLREAFYAKKFMPDWGFVVPGGRPCYFRLGVNG